MSPARVPPAGRGGVPNESRKRWTPPRRVAGGFTGERKGRCLGAGLIRIGRRWGHAAQEAVSEPEALAFLEHALHLGIRYYDTAPSYGLSEERLGKFLRSLTPERRAQLTIATKFGEHWNAGLQEPYVDHSFDALRRSLDQSLARLGRIDVLQLHKTVPAVLASPHLAKSWEYARSLGIAKLGASVSDLESAAIAIGDPQYWCIQLPLNIANRTFESAAASAAARGMFVAVNRPFAMGAMLAGPAPIPIRDAFRYLLDRRFEGVILTGTADIVHLDENWTAFHQSRTT
jgi:aryl-alcohol dehydrogenase-like predicted oxidoreductase